MAKFSKLDTLLTMRQSGLVVVFYNSDLEISKSVMKACYDGGVRHFEFTNRGDFAVDIFSALVKYAREECPDMVMGAGSIVDAPTAALYIQYGADFVVSPYLNEEVAKLCNRHLVPYTPGCGTASEIGRAHELGCDIVKIFPAGCVGGPSFVKSVLAPLPWSNIMVTGGVAPTAENLDQWFGAGAMCVGIGSQLFPKEVVAAQQWSRVSDSCKEALSVISKYKD